MFFIYVLLQTHITFINASRIWIHNKLSLTSCNFLTSLLKKIFLQLFAKCYVSIWPILQFRLNTNWNFFHLSIRSRSMYQLSNLKTFVKLHMKERQIDKKEWFRKLIWNQMSYSERGVYVHNFKMEYFLFAKWIIFQIIIFEAKHNL